MGICQRIEIENSSCDFEIGISLPVIIQFSVGKKVVFVSCKIIGKGDLYYKRTCGSFDFDWVEVAMRDVNLTSFVLTFIHIAHQCTPLIIQQSHSSARSAPVVGHTILVNHSISKCCGSDYYFLRDGTPRGGSHQIGKYRYIDVIQESLQQEPVYTLIIGCIIAEKCCYVLVDPSVSTQFHSHLGLAPSQSISIDELEKKKNGKTLAFLDCSGEFTEFWEL